MANSWRMAPSIGYAPAPRIIPTSRCYDFLGLLISIPGDQSLFIKLPAMSGLASGGRYEEEFRPDRWGLKNPSRQEAGD
jgi:hypothetical protein